MNSEKHDIFNDIFESDDFKNPFNDLRKVAREKNPESIPFLNVSVRVPYDIFKKLKKMSNNMGITHSKLSHIIITSFITKFSKMEESNGESQ